MYHSNSLSHFNQSNLAKKSRFLKESILTRLSESDKRNSLHLHFSQIKKSQLYFLFKIYLKNFSFSLIFPTENSHYFRLC